MITLLETIHSKIDATKKFIYLNGNHLIEVSVIDKGDGKDIICVPTQTACNLKCKFCFMSDCDLKVENLTDLEIVEAVRETVRNALEASANDVLLISFMGCGEPLLNYRNVVSACDIIRWLYCGDYGTVRFAVASIIPSLSNMIEFTKSVKEYQLPLKFHLSLHSANGKIRRDLIPAAQPIFESLDLVNIFVNSTGNAAEIHYSLIDGINDTDDDLLCLPLLIYEFTDIRLSVKFISYNQKPGSKLSRSGRLQDFMSELTKYGVKNESYTPPGGDIGSSCGQFLMDYYKKYSS